MDTYISICKIDHQWEFAVWLRKIRSPMGICCMAQENQTGALYQPRGVERGGRWEGVSKGRGYMYIYG